MNLNELSFDRLGSWPVPVRIIALAGALVIILILGYLFLIQPRLMDLNHLEKKQSDLKTEYQSESKQANTLPEYEKQLNDIQKNIANLNKQFTTAEKIPQVINTISKLAAANSLTINSIKPEQENAQTFYIILPIQISVTSDYHHLALFVSEIESLQKIITFGDFTITALNDQRKDGLGARLLMMNATVKIYMLNVPEDDGKS